MILVTSELRSLLTKETWRIGDRNQAYRRPLTVKWAAKVKKLKEAFGAGQQ